MDLSLSLHPPIQKKRKRASKPPSSSSNPPFPPSQPAPDGIDRLTALPEDLRLHILSLLPLPSAIQTGVLSSHWTNLWKSLLNPDPRRHHTALLLKIPPSEDRYIDPLPYLRRLSNLLLDPENFFLSVHISLPLVPRFLPAILIILRNAATRGVRDLHLDLRSASPTFRRPKLNLDITVDVSSFVKLSLAGFRLPRLPYHYKNFSSLEILKFDGVNLADTTFRVLVSNCKFLRSLDVRRCPDLKRVVIIGSKIEKLIVVECGKVKEVAVRSKILKLFHFKGWFAEEFMFKGVEELEDVYMASNGPDLGQPTSNWAVSVRGLRHVRVLTLCSVSLQHIMTADPNVIWKFESLQCLKELQLRMFCFTEGNLMDIYNFFKLCYCPNLEKLFIQLPNKKNDPHMENPLQIMTNEAPILCDLANLKTIKIKRFNGGRYEMQLVKFFLANCRNLGSLIVVSPQENQKEPGKLIWDINCHIMQCFRVKIDLMTKSSKNVKIVVSKDDDVRVRPTHEGYFCRCW